MIPQVFGDARRIVAQMQVVVPCLGRGIGGWPVQEVFRAIIIEFTPVTRATKRAGYAHEDTVWTTICGTDETDTDKIDEVLTIGTYAEYLELKEQLLIEKET